MTSVVVRPRILPGYDVIDLMWEGSDLCVYAAYSRRRHCECVLKAVRPERLGDDQVVAALELEARLLLSFTHPHWVRAYELSRQPVTGAPVLVMELLQGRDLDEQLEEGPGRLSVPKLLSLGLHLCSAIAYLHDHGYVHLDVNPANVNVDDGGLTRLLDLSLATPIGSPCEPGMGTAVYLPPEQARGDPVTAAADSWGIGMTLYEAATGKLLFAAAEVPGNEYPQLSSCAVPVRQWRPRLPRALSELIDACLRPDPEQRPGIAELHSTFAALAGD